MLKSKTPIQYAVYTRKSSDSEDKQVHSLARQESDLQSVIDRQGLHTTCPPFEEFQSAFKIGRPVFDQLVRQTLEGKINGWVCWHLNRLARNPIDSGTVIDLMERGDLKEIVTYSQVYTNSPSDKFMLALEFGISRS